jgi:hypothetical protein
MEDKAAALALAAWARRNKIHIICRFMQPTSAVAATVGVRLVCQCTRSLGERDDSSTTKIYLVDVGVRPLTGLRYMPAVDGRISSTIGFSSCLGEAV